MAPNPIYKRQLAMFEALRRLGFSSDDIYVMFNHGRPLTILRAQGKQFAVEYPPPDPVIATNEEYVRAWKVAADEWNALDDVGRSAIYEEHFLRLPGAGGIVMALLDKGFTLPRTVN